MVCRRILKQECRKRLTPVLGKLLQECKMCFSAVKIIANCRNKGKKVVTMAILNFSDVLKNVGLDPKEVKLIRHALSDKRFRISLMKYF